MRNTALAALVVLLLAGRDAAAAEHASHGPGPGDSLAAAAAPVTAPSAPSVALAPETTVDLAAASAAVERSAGRQRGLDVRVWTEDAREVFNAGDRTRVFFRATRDAYVAVLHIDTNGNLQVLFPASPSEDGRVAARRLYALPTSGLGRWWTVDGNPGIGYLFTVASDEPLEFRNIRGAFGYRPAARQDGRAVYGDPYDAIERISHLLVPGWHEVERALDVYAYHVGGRFTHPRYACYDGYGTWAYSRSASYGSCERVRLLLGHHPGYYDARGLDAGWLEQRRAAERDTRTYAGRTGGDRLRGGGDAPPVRDFRDVRPTELRQPPQGGERGRDAGAGSSRGTQAPASRREPPARAHPTLERRREGGDRPAATPSRPSGGGTERPAASPPPKSSGGSSTPSPRPSGGGDRGRPGGAQ
jgi:hypothetical protein